MIPRNVVPATTSLTAFFGAGTFNDVDPQPGDTVPVTLEVDNWNEFVELVTDPGPDLASAVAAFFENGGIVAWIVLTADDSAEALSQKLNAWDGPDEPSLVNIVTVPALGGFTGPAYDQVSLAMAAAAERTTSLAVLEPPRATMSAVIATDDVTALVTLADHLRTILPNDQQTRSALYASSLPADVYIPDAGPTAALPISGAVAGIMATIDEERGVWKPPAGVTAGVIHFKSSSFQPTTAQIGQLNVEGVNTVVVMPGYGVVVWGARTLAGNDLGESPFKYVSTRRLTDFVDSSLRQSMTWAVFEPNTPALWSALELEATTFMSGLYGQGAFAGNSPATAYSVVVNAATTPPQDQADGIVNVEIGFAPISPGEFVESTVQLTGAVPQ